MPGFKKLRKLGKPQSMDSPEREYVRNLFIYQQAYRDLVKASLGEVLPKYKQIIKGEKIKKPVDIRTYDGARYDSLSSRFDSNIEDGLKKMFEGVQAKLESMYPDSTLRRWSQAMVGHVNSVSKKNVISAAKTADLEIEPLLTNGKLNPFFQNVVDENVGLIRSIPKDKMEAFKNQLVHAISKDASNRDISKLISKNFGATESKANLIARDQVNKLNGTLNKYRQQQLGGRRYIWRTAEDERVRPDHADLNGKTFFWTKPPITDRKTRRRNHPGQDFQCRCHAEMVIDDLIDED